MGRPAHPFFDVAPYDPPEMPPDPLIVEFDRSAEHRIGRRHPIDSVSIGWRIDRVTGGRRKQSDSQQGMLLDLSLSGLRVLAPTDPNLQIGQTVLVEIGGFVGSVMIRRVTPSDEEGQSVYGVEFLPSGGEMARSLVARVEQLLGDRHISRP